MYPGEEEEEEEREKRCGEKRNDEIIHNTRLSSGAVATAAAKTGKERERYTTLRDDGFIRPEGKVSEKGGERGKGS